MTIFLVQFFILIVIYHSITIIRAKINETSNLCVEVKKSFAGSYTDKQTCQCALDPVENNYDNPNKFWIGCTSQKMPAVYRFLTTLNATQVSHLHIWDSLINIVPNDMFAQVRPVKLTIENSRVGVIRKSAFSNVKLTLKELNLKNNILKNIDSNTLADLTSLTLLDLSGNKLMEFKRQHFSNLSKLEILMLHENQLSFLEDGLFQSLSNLKILNLAKNRIKTITKDTFKGLTKLEVLNLRENQIDWIDEDAFIHLKCLRSLDLCNNKISYFNIQDNLKLERLILSNNSIGVLNNVKVRNLPNLKSLYLENNQISTILDKDFAELRQSPKFVSLVLDGNNISWIGCRAFEPLTNLLLLSLQRNKISSLTCSSMRDPYSFFVYLDHSILESLHSLQRLLLSYNSITIINDEDFVGLTSLRDLILDHNKIIKIARDSFKELNIKRLFLNNNHLYYLPKGIFSSWNISNLEAIDISENNWECICEQEWIGTWLAQLGYVNTPSGTLGCLIGKCEESTSRASIYEDTADGYDVWIRVMACILAFATISFLLIAGFIYVQGSHYTLPMKRFSSDTFRLIQSQENLFSFPNPIMTTEVESKRNSLNERKETLSLMKNASSEKIPDEWDETKKDKKKVRFNE